MYFSRIELQREGVDSGKLARMLCADSYRYHQHIWRIFSGFSKEQRKFLYRREEVAGWPRFYVVSQRPPNNQDGLWDIQTKEYNPRLRAGQRFAFSLRANPVVTRQDAEGHRARHDVIMDAKVRVGYKKLLPKERLPFSALIQDAGFQWLGTRAEKHGFSVSEDGIKVDGYMQHRTFKKGGKHPIRFSTLDFTGLLTVAEPNIFVQTLFNGIGPAKGFGCGMMMVRRL